MNFPSTNLSPFHLDVLQQTELGQLCGKRELFRNQYQIIRMLGRGGFGVTFLARDLRLPSGPLCVIKQLCPKFKDIPGLILARERFEREAKTLSKLGSHSQVPRLLNYFIIEEEFYLVQEYVQGTTLARLVRRTGTMSEVAVTRFLREMLNLLTYVHSNQVIHRDIKPQNIIRCSQDNRLVLIDFGAVKEITQLAETGIKGSTTQFIGTVGFAPPEQFSMRPVYATDIYALAVTCIYLLTGKAPLDLETDPATGELQWREGVWVSDSLARILNKMLKISLKERYQSAEAVLRAMNKESPQDNLAHCMTVQPRPKFDLITYKKQQPSSKDYHTPTYREAIAIRDWKSRLQKKSRPHQTKVEGLVSSSSY